MRKATKVCETWRRQGTYTVCERDLESFQSPTGLSPGNKPVYVLNFDRYLKVYVEAIRR